VDCEVFSSSIGCFSKKWTLSVFYGRCPPQSNTKMRQQEIATNKLFFIVQEKKKKKKKERETLV